MIFMIKIIIGGYGLQGVLPPFYMNNSRYKGNPEKI